MPTAVLACHTDRFLLYCIMSVGQDSLASDLQRIHCTGKALLSSRNAGAQLFQQLALRQVQPLCISSILSDTEIDTKLSALLLSICSNHARRARMKEQCAKFLYSCLHQR